MESDGCMTTRLEFARKGCERSSSHRFLSTTRAFFKHTPEALMVAGLLFAPMLFPKAARAQDATSTATAWQKQIQNLTVVQLEKPLSQLEKETEAMTIGGPHGGISSESSNACGYGINVMTSEANFVVVNSNGKWGMAVAFNFNGKKDWNGDGTRGADLSEFAKMVETQTGRKMERVKIILVTGSINYNGKEVPLTNACILPIDSKRKSHDCIG